MPLDEEATLTPPSPVPGKKYFSVEEADRALPYVRRIVDDVVGVYSEIVELRRRLEEHDEPFGATSEVETLYEKAMDRLGELVDELHAVGVELKDFERGLVDFPAVFEEREVLLCWHRGEDRVGHWHEVDAGFGGRRSIEVMSAQVA